MKHQEGFQLNITDETPILTLETGHKTMVRDINALIQHPTDLALEQAVKGHLDDVELYLLDQAPQQTLRTF